MLVYRVENEYGNGPYDQSGDYSIPRGVDYYLRYDDTAHSVENNRPSPYCDGLVSFNNYHRCAFRSTQELKHWFWDEDGRKEMTKGNFNVSVYNIDDIEDNVLYGHHQVMFNRDNATKVDTLSLAEI